jgi:hypothetical protein
MDHAVDRGKAVNDVEQFLQATDDPAIVLFRVTATLLLCGSDSMADIA